MSGVLLALVALAVLGATGGAIASALPRARIGPVGLVFEALAIGLLVQELIGVAALRLGHYSRTTVLIVTLVVIAASIAVRLRIRRPAAARAPARSGPAARVDLVLLAGLVVVLGIALAIRQGPSYFIFETGDMGEYVNGANVLAHAGTLTASFPHGFTLFLSGTNLLLGRAHTVAGLPALGVLLALGSFAYARVVGLHPVAALGIAALAAANPVTVWFSLFPVSETLYATLLIAALYFVVQARATRSNAYAVIAGLVLGLMLLVRGNAMLFAPIVVLVLLASAAVDDERTVRVQRTFSVVALGALAAAYAYDVHYPRTYFVQTQLREMLPHSIFRAADRVHLFQASVPLALVALAGIAAVLGAVVLVTRHVRPRVVDRPETFWRALYVAALVVTLAALAVMQHGGLTDALARWGVVLVVLALVGLVALVARPGRYLDGGDGWLLLLVVCAFSLLFAKRVHLSKPHAYYLYYDRYLFSEVLPAALVLGAVGLHLLVDAWVSAVRSRVVVVRVAVAVVCVAAVVAFVPSLKETHRITRYPLFGDSYQTLHRIDELTRTKDAGPGAIVYSAGPTPPAGWFFQNTYRAFALPLAQTFGRHMIGMPVDPFASDVRFDPDAARAALRRSGLDHGYLVSLRAPDAQPLADDDRVRLVGTVDYTSPVLRRTANRAPAAFQLVAFRFDVYSLR